MLKLSSWNILADSLSKNEFLSHTEDELVWSIRGPKIINIIQNMLNESNIVVLQECDKFDEIKEHFLNNILLVGKNIAILWRNVQFISFDGKSCLFSFEYGSSNECCLSNEFNNIQKMFNIYPLHLKSGEGSDNAIKRIEILKS